MSVPLLAGITAVGLVSLLVFLKRKNSKKCTSKTDLTGKTAIVTGANTGIGFWTAQDFAVRNARVILACRSVERGTAARDKMVAATGNTNVAVHHLDLFDFTSVRRFVQHIKQHENRLDILVNNAGVCGLPQRASEHGLEVTLATNHFGPFLLTLLLMDLLKKSAPSRIVNLSSRAHMVFAKKGIDFDNLHDEKPNSTMGKYAASKLANLLFTRELARRLKDTGVTAYCVHPGVVVTEIVRYAHPVFKILVRLLSFLFKAPEEGAQTSIYVSVSEEVKGESGKYYVDCAQAEKEVNPLANDPQLASRLWHRSAELTGVSADI